MKWSVFVFLLLCASSQLPSVTHGAKIIFLCGVSSRSQKNFYAPIASVLAERGHQITFLSPFKPKKEEKNIREIVLKSGDLATNSPNYLKMDAVAKNVNVLDGYAELCSDAMDNPEVKQLRHEHYDLVVVSVLNDCFLALNHYYKVPVIGLNPSAFNTGYDVRIGNLFFPSFTPSMGVTTQPPYTFLQRTQSMMYDLFMTYILDYDFLPKTESICRARGLCPPDMPPLPKLTDNFSLVIMNSVKVLEVPARPTSPNLIYAGGIHCHPAEPLPKDLKLWTEESGDEGFILFSLGSIFKSEFVPEEYIKIFIEVFGSLKQRVLWKWDSDPIKNLPSNIKLSNWLPQQDILGNSHIRLFITHGGLLSTLEATYHGVPLIGLPIFIDQNLNMGEADAIGYGKTLSWSDLSVELLRDSINDVLINKRMSAIVQDRSTKMKDQLVPPSRTVTYWIEHVLKYNGAMHLRPPIASMMWYELYNVDVWSLLILIILTFGYVLCAVFRYCCCKRSRKSLSKIKTS